jgi:hypothetical protein
MPTPLGSPSHRRFSDQTTPHRSRKRTLDDREDSVPPRPRHMDIMEDEVNSPPGSYQTSGSKPHLPPTSDALTSNTIAINDHRNGSSEIPSSTPTNGQHEETAPENNLVDTLEPGGPLEPFDWNNLEERFNSAMEERLHTEAAIQQDFQKLMEVGSQSQMLSTTYNALILMDPAVHHMGSNPLHSC